MKIAYEYRIFQHFGSLIGSLEKLLKNVIITFFKYQINEIYNRYKYCKIKRFLDQFYIIILIQIICVIYMIYRV